MKAMIAKKIGMTSLFRENGEMLPVTVLYAGDNYITQIKTKKKDGYDAVQIGVELSSGKNMTMAEKGHQKSLGHSCSILREFRVAPSQEMEAGKSLSLSALQQGEKVKVTGVSKGKGFQGVMKRHGFGGGRASHGSGFHRSPGSLGASAYPSRVFKGRKLPGRMGFRTTSISNLAIELVDKEKSLIFLRGSVPGHRASYMSLEVLP